MPILPKTRSLIALCGLLFLFMTGCSPVVGQGQSQVATTESGGLSASSTVGQTFTARHAGLSGLEIYLAPGAQPAGGDVVLHLRENPQTDQDIQAARLPASAVDHPGFYSFTFSPQPNSYLKDYYLLLELQGEASLKAGTAPGSAYTDGAFYANGSPLDQQLAFQQLYSRSWLAYGMLRQGLQWLWQVLLALAVFLLPGWAVLSGLWSGWRDLDWGEKAGLAGGTSLALIPVFMLWMNVLGLRLGILFALVPLITSAAFLAWRSRRIFSGGFFRKPIKVDWPSAGLAAALLMVFAIRFWVIRGIDYPMWGDSYQHTVIAQLILDHQGLTQSWAPYAPYISLTVQYGFPADAALYAWISGAQSPQAAIWTGQVLNGLAILGLYPLALRLSKRQRWAGVAAVLAGGLWMAMPMYYVNWGRYAQLGGQAILPAAIWLCWDAFAQPKTGLKKVLIAGLVLTGMLLTYYRMFFYFGTFFLAWLAAWGLPAWRLRWMNWRTFLVTAGAIILAAGVLVFPWLANVSGSSLAGAIEGGLTAAPAPESVAQDYIAWKDLVNYVPAGVLFLAALALGWSLVRREWAAAGIALWAGLMAAVKAGQLINLPGANMMQSFAVLIFLYIPASLLVGWFLGRCAGWLHDHFRRAAGAVIFLAVAGAALWGAYQLRDVSNPAFFAYVTRPDLRAADWIRAQTDPAAVFLVEGYRIYNGTTAVGADGGWWLSFTAARRNSMPPQYALMAEIPDPQDYSRQVVSLLAVLEASPPNTPQGLAAMCRMGITHIYIGQGQGLTGFGARQLYNREQLLSSGQFSEIYHQDRVSVFAIQPGACQSAARVGYEQP